MCTIEYKGCIITSIDHCLYIPMKILAFLFSILATLFNGHNVNSKPPVASQYTISRPTPNITSTPAPENAPQPTIAQLLRNEPTESGCPQEGHIKSPSSFNAATITFDNQTAADLKVYWIDFNGNRKYYRTVKAHSKYDQGTWVGHVWVVAGAGDQCVKLESANAVNQVLVID